MKFDRHRVLNEYEQECLSIEKETETIHVPSELME